MYELDMEKQKKEIKCEHCGHKWKTKSKLKFVTCSNCQKKTKR